MIRIELQVGLNFEIDQAGADFVFNIHAARTACQSIVTERFELSQPATPQLYTDAASGNRYLRLHAGPGVLKVSYAATVDLVHHFAKPEQVAEVPVHHLPPEVIAYIYPSRYCQSDLFVNLAMSTFGGLDKGYSRVLAIEDWVRKNVTFKSRSSTTTTSAIDTLNSKVGVCRDFAHLMIALCRALNIPARFATGTDYGADPALGPPDFQAYVEVYLGQRWYIFDPSGTGIPMGFIRFGTGRDAADVSFATIFGGVRTHAPVIAAVALNDPAQGFVLPQRCTDALSTDRGVDTCQA
ncbi:MAG: transglutaminase family protein [Dechloromonas sp.]|nr:transglutaminase family protein [Dechloromonas sp.]